MSLRDKHKSEMEECEWELLKQNIDRGAVILVDQKLDLLDVAQAVAEDQVQTVANWLQNGDLVNVSDFESEAMDLRVRFVIIQPYVLVQKIS